MTAVNTTVVNSIANIRLRLEDERGRIFPNQYRRVDGYTSHDLAWKAAFVWLDLKAEEMAGRVTLNDEQIEKALNLMCASISWLLHGCATYHVGINLLPALKATENPPNLNSLLGSPWPRNGLMFLLPDSELLTGNNTRPEQLVDWILLTRTEPGDHPRILSLIGGIPNEPIKEPPQTAYRLFVHYGDGKISYVPWTLSMGLPPAEVLDGCAIDPQVFRLSLNLLTVLSARAELVESHQPLKPMHGDGINEKLWEPRWIGKNYRITRARRGGGTHASPRLHIRNGHWRMQPCGPRADGLRRLRWIEPCLVDAAADNTAGT